MVPKVFEPLKFDCLLIAAYILPVVVEGQGHKLYIHDGQTRGYVNFVI